MQEPHVSRMAVQPHTGWLKVPSFPSDRYAPGAGVEIRRDMLEGIEWE